MAEHLPSFKNPPIVETALSVQFKSLPKFSNADLGLFWAQLRKDYPIRSDADPIEPQTERFGTDVLRVPRLPTFKLVASRAAVRLQMASADGHAMIQVQNGRLAYNWRRLQDGTYPRWRAVYPAFKDALNGFQKFVAAEGLGDLEPNQWEVSYVNHLERGRDWGTPSDWTRLIPGLVGTAARLPVGELEGLESNWRFALPDSRGRLHVDLSHGYLGMDAKAGEVLTLQLTARGAIDTKRAWDLDSGLNMGREAIVLTFEAITGRDAHVLWKREP